MQSAVVYSLNHDTTMSFGIHLTPIFQNLAPACTCIIVWVHPYAHPQNMKVLNLFIHIQYGCGMQSVVAYSLNHDTHNNVILASPYPIFPKFSSHRQRYNSVMVHPYAHPQHMKLLNHFIYIHYGCEMQSAVAHSVNHDTTMSFRLNLTRISQNLSPTCTGISVRVHPYAHPQHMKVLKHYVYFQNGCGRQSVVAYSLNHDTTAHLGSTLPQFSNIWPQSAQVV